MFVYTVILNYQMTMSYFKGTPDAVAVYCSAVNCQNAPNTWQHKQTSFLSINTCVRLFTL